MALDPITGGEELANTIAGIVGRFIPDPAAATAAKLALLQALQSSDIAQDQVNQAEAASGGMYNAGWRPFVGWSCGVALAYTYLLVPIVAWIGYVIGHPVPRMPALDDHLYELMLGMLGLAATRTYEKVQGVS